MQCVSSPGKDASNFVSLQPDKNFQTVIVENLNGFLKQSNFTTREYDWL